MKQLTFALSALALAGFSSASMAKVQVLWHHQDGTNYILEHQGAVLEREHELSHIPTEWQLQAKGDVNGDGMEDLIWRSNVTGEVYLYLMKGSEILYQDSLAVIADQNWQIATVNDFNGDHKADIVWRHKQTGEYALWLMDGIHHTHEIMLPQVSDLDWQIAGSGDLNGDGTSDLVWRNRKTGDNYLFMMKDGYIAWDGDLFSVADTHWQIANLGDFNGDGKTDLFWRNNQTGENYVILMNGHQVLAERDLMTVSDQNWQVVGSADFDSDGKTDLVWRNKHTGENYLFLMNGVHLKDALELGTVADQGWQVATILNNQSLTPAIKELYQLASGKLVSSLALQLVVGQAHTQLMLIQNLASPMASFVLGEPNLSHSGSLYCGNNPFADTGMGKYDYELTLSAQGNGIKLNYHACQISTLGSLDGGIVLASDSLIEQEASARLEIEADLNNLQFSPLDGNYQTGVFNGHIGLAEEYSLDSDQDAGLISMVLDANLQAVIDSKTVEIKNYHSETQVNALDKQLSTTFNAQVIESNISYFVNTPSPWLVQSDNNDLLVSGSLQIDSETGKNLLITVQGTNLVFELDLNNDGKVDITETYPINQLD